MKFISYPGSTAMEVYQLPSYEDSVKPVPSYSSGAQPDSPPPSYRDLVEDRDEASASTQQLREPPLPIYIIHQRDSFEASDPETSLDLNPSSTSSIHGNLIESLARRDTMDLRTLHTYSSPYSCDEMPDEHYQSQSTA